jgi:LysR family nitrogen assimilation transcriptional regulator
MNSKQLQYFLVTAKRGSIAGAARELDIAQPAVSHQLASLEREVGAELFIRNFKGVSLTLSGELFAAHAKKIMTNINTAKMDLQQVIASTAGKVRLGILPSMGNVLSLSLITELNRQHPHLELEISTAPSYSVKEWLKNDQIDIALTFEQEVDNNFMSAYPLIEEFLYLVVGVNENSADYQKLRHRDSISFWELSQYELLTRGSKDSLRHLIEKYEKETGVALKQNKTYSGQLMTGLRQVIQGQGLMILPSSATFHLESSNVLKSLKIIEPEMKRLVLLATNNTKPLLPATMQLIEVIKQVTATQQQLYNWRGELPENSLFDISAKRS